MVGYNSLELLVGLPLLAGLFCLILSDRFKDLARIVSLLVSLAVFAGSVYLFINKPGPWQLGSNIMLASDNLSSFIALGISFFALTVSVYSLTYSTRSLGRYFGYILITLGAALGAAFSVNFIALLVFWGIVAAMLYLLVNIAGTEASAVAAKKAIIIVGGTDALLIFGVGLIWHITGSFNMGASRIGLSGLTAFSSYLVIAAAGLAKAGAMPFHSWVPEVAEHAPISVTAYLPASVDKLLGIYLLMRASLTIFKMSDIANLVLLIVGAITIVFAVLFALVQHDMKKLLGYHAVSQVGYMVLGIGTANPIGMAGALFHMLNNSIYKSCLFLSAGNVEHRSGETDLSKLGGLAKYMPITFAAFFVASLSISGIPPFNGFVSKWMLYQGVIASVGLGGKLKVLWLVAAMFGSALTVASFMKLIHAVFLGRPDGDFAHIKEAPFNMTMPVVVLASICIIFGIGAFVLPLPLLIAPAIGLGISYSGAWQPMPATLLILAGLVIGVGGYLLLKTAKFRQTDTFVGGWDPDKLGRVDGTEFYNTVTDIKMVGKAVKLEAGGGFDIYSISSSIIKAMSRPLRFLHNGILPTYMVWCLLGAIGIMFFIFLR
ncbi:MAG: proton-conducting transporter membrane subunit [Candidatus Omnitrophica bacterium]|nr:proton-conducting transporter membrane subunit [Candidatus Omnitrophota bacterium]